IYFTALLLYSIRRLFFLNDPATPEIYTLSLHDALPISSRRGQENVGRQRWLPLRAEKQFNSCGGSIEKGEPRSVDLAVFRFPERSEEHTSELQSPYDLVCRLLLEKKKYNRRILYKVK